MQLNKDYSADELEKIIIKGLLSFFKDRVQDFATAEKTDTPFIQFGFEFEIYNYFIVRFNYSRGGCGFCIVNGELGIDLDIEPEWFEEIKDLNKYFKKLEKEIELRIPDKFLKAKGWKK